jgi:hypothetical protein
MSQEPPFLAQMLEAAFMEFQNFSIGKPALRTTSVT